MKQFKQYNKGELASLFEELDLELPGDSYTKTDLLFTLEEAGITASSVESFKKKQKAEDNETPAAMDSMAVVCMDRKNSLYQIGRHKFSQDNKYILMTVDEANEILANHTGFHKASREEVKAYFK